MSPLADPPPSTAATRRARNRYMGGLNRSRRDPPNRQCQTLNMFITTGSALANSDLRLKANQLGDPPPRRSPGWFDASIGLAPESRGWRHRFDRHTASRPNRPGYSIRTVEYPNSDARESEK